MHSRSVLCMTGHHNFYYVCMYVCVAFQPTSQSEVLRSTLLAKILYLLFSSTVCMRRIKRVSTHSERLDYGDKNVAIDDFRLFQ